MSEERKMRITCRNEEWAVQYGYYKQRGSTSRFIALREWPAENLEQAHVIAAREKINVAFDPPAVDAEPLVEKRTVRRAIIEAPLNVRQVVKDGLYAALVDPMPTPEESHQKLGLPCPAARGGIRQFYVALAEPVYGLLCAMAAGAGVSRNRVIEALLLNAVEEELRNG